MRLNRFFIALALISALSVSGSLAHAFDARCVDIFFSGSGKPSAKRVRISEELELYESGRDLYQPRLGKPYRAQHGWKVLERDMRGRAKRVQVRLLVDNPGLSGHIQIIGPFNNWGRSLRPSDTLTAVPGQIEMCTAAIEGLTNGTPYRLMIDGHQVLDPTATMFTTPEYEAREGRPGQGPYLNSVFWDHADPRNYQMRTQRIDLHDKPAIIAELELHSLVQNFTTQSGQTGPRQTAETYKFIAESGVIERLKEAGYNAVELMPFNQSMDGESWHLRYQVYGLFAPDSRYGNPAEFKMMVDAFHRAGIAVIMDAVISHFPFHGNEGGRKIEGIGLDQWMKADGRPLYTGQASPWDTYRYDYTNPYLRRFLIDSVLFMMSEFRIDGIRFDNVDGITESPGGTQLVKEIVKNIRDHVPRAFLIAESFFPPGDLLHRVDRGGFGMNTRNDGNLFQLWHHQAQSPTEALDLSAFGHAVRDPWAWKSVPLLRYLTNHDESANSRGGFTGQYPASLIGDPYYAFNKIKVFDTFNLLVGSYHLSLPQARMMQTGSFYSNPAIEWSLARHGSGRELWDYFASLARYVESRPKAFSFESLHPDIENHVDNTNKVISLHRVDAETGEEIYAILNFGHQELHDYSFGVVGAGRYRLVHDSDRAQFGGQNRVQQAIPGGVLQTESRSQHGKPNALRVPLLPPYGALIFEAIH